jgi:phage terminase small subunit
MSLSKKQKCFVEHYLRCWNASEAARRAGYSERTAGAQGSRLLKKVEIAKEIKRRLEDMTLSADEVLVRLGEQARASVGDFLTTHEGVRGFFLDLDAVKEKGHLVKSAKMTTRGPVIQLYDSQAALIQIGKHHGLFTDRIEHTGKGGEELIFRVVYGDNRESGAPARSSPEAGGDQGE